MYSCIDYLAYLALALRLRLYSSLHYYSIQLIAACFNKLKFSYIINVTIVLNVAEHRAFSLQQLSFLFYVRVQELWPIKPVMR